MFGSTDTPEQDDFFDFLRMEDAVGSHEWLTEKTSRMQSEVSTSPLSPHHSKTAPEKSKDPYSL